MTRSIFAAAATLVLAACGGSSTGLGQSGHCSVTLSGAQTGTYDCQTAFAAWDSSKNQGSFGFQVAQSGTAPGIVAAITFPGEPHSATFSQSDTGASGGVIVSGASSSYWIASSDASSTQGTYSLKLTGVSSAYSNSSGKTYSTTGTVDGTLPAASGSGASGTVTLHATF